MNATERIEAAAEQQRRESLFRDREGRWPSKTEARRLDGDGYLKA